MNYEVPTLHLKGPNNCGKSKLVAHIESSGPGQRIGKAFKPLKKSDISVSLLNEKLSNNTGFITMDPVPYQDKKSKEVFDLVIDRYYQDRLHVTNMNKNKLKNVTSPMTGLVAVWPGDKGFSLKELECTFLTRIIMIFQEKLDKSPDIIKLWSDAL